MKTRSKNSSPATPHPSSGIMSRFTRFLPKRVFPIILSVTTAALLSVSAAQGEITYSGNLNPTTDPSTWTTSTVVRVGDSANGNLNIDGGSAVNSGISYLGYAAAATGTATVTNGTWTSSANRYLGYNGTGVLNITDGGNVSNTSGYLGSNLGSAGIATVDGGGSMWTNSINLWVGNNNGTGVLNILNGANVLVAGTTTVGTLGTVNFGANGGTLKTGALTTSSGQFTGTGTVVTSTFRGDADIVVATAEDLVSTIGTWNDPGQNITHKLDLSGAGGDIAGILGLGAGNQSTASLTIKNGLGVGSYIGYVGDNSGSTANASVDGPGSSWTMRLGSYIGFNGTGVLNITNGGAVSNTIGYIGYNAGSTGTATVDGTGSTWTNSGELYVGRTGTGTLNITNGGTVSNTIGYVGYNNGSQGTTTVDGTGSTWANSGNLYVGANSVGGTGTGTLNITNGGTVSSTGAYVRGNGAVTLDGAGSTLTTSGELIVSNVLNILNDSSVLVAGPTTVNINSPGTINFGSSGGTLTTGALLASSGQLTGTGTINTTEWAELGNSDLVFDAAHGMAGTTTVSDASRNLTINYDLSGGINNAYVGYTKNGSLTIKDGLSFNSAGPGFVGHAAGTTGTATVSDTNSKWTVGNMLTIGEEGAGYLNITNGGTVSSAGGYLGFRTGSVGTATVSGAGSTWTNNSDLDIGVYREA